MNYRESALEMLINRRGCVRGGLQWNYLTRAAWKYVQMAMKKPARDWTDTPPKSTLGL